MFIIIMCMAMIGPVLPVATSLGPSLSLHVSGPQTVEGVEDLILTTTITNTGDTTLKILNDPRSPLSGVPADIFDIKDAAGRKPLFTGIEIPYDASKMAATGSEDVFTILAPGDCVNIKHDLSLAYNFTLLGSGSYIFSARNLFYHVELSTSAVASLHAHAFAHEAWISNKLSFTHQSSGSLRKRAFIGCTPGNQEILRLVASAARTYVLDAERYLRTVVPTGHTLRYVKWFGIMSPNRYLAVFNSFTNFLNVNFAELTFNCRCDQADKFAWVDPTVYGTIHICPPFWQIGNEKIGILINQASYWPNVANAAKYMVTQSDCKTLAILFPDTAIRNAASFAYFAVDTGDI